MTGTRMTHVPYNGGGPATIAVVAGHVPVYIMSPVQAAPHMKSSRLRALAVTSDKRDPAFPELPTIAEAGVPGYAMINWSTDSRARGNTPTRRDEAPCRDGPHPESAGDRGTAGR